MRRAAQTNTLAIRAHYEGVLRHAIIMVAEEGSEVCLDFRGKTYTLGFAEDARGMLRAQQP